MEFSINQLERVERRTNLNRSQIVLPAAKLLESLILWSTANFWMTAYKILYSPKQLI